MKNKFILTIFTSLLICAKPAFAIELGIKNDLNKNYDGIELSIEDATSLEAPRNRVSFKVELGEVKTITNGNVRSFFLVRKFNRHKLRYDIVCPKKITNEKRQIITVSQAHENKLPAGCKVVRIGHSSKHTGTNWDVIDKTASQQLQDERRGNNSLRRQ